MHLFRTALAAMALCIGSALPARAPTGVAVFLGDSITAGAPWASVCHLAINLGRNSATSARVREIAERSLPDLRPATVVILVGVNDIAAGLDPSVTRRNVEAIVAAAGRARVLVFRVLPVAPHYPRARYNVAIASINQALAGLEGAELVTFAPAPGHYRADGIHLTPSAYAAWLPRLRAAGLCR